MRYRRNADEDTRALERQVVAGDLGLVPSLARAYEREGRGESPGVLRDVIASFEHVEQVVFAMDGPEDILHFFDDNRADEADGGLRLDVDIRISESAEAFGLAYDVGLIRGVASALGLTIRELWAMSERARGGAGAERRERIRDQWAEHGVYDNAPEMLRLLRSMPRDVRLAHADWPTRVSHGTYYFPPAATCERCRSSIGRPRSSDTFTDDIIRYHASGFSWREAPEVDGDANDAAHAWRGVCAACLRSAGYDYGPEFFGQLMVKGGDDGDYPTDRLEEIVRRR